MAINSYNYNVNIVRPWLYLFHQGTVVFSTKALKLKIFVSGNEF